jgi:hypothetical protein
VGERAVSEAAIQRSIVETVRNLGHVVIRVQSGKVKVRGGWMTLAEPGTPDLCLPFLRAWGETKTPKGKLSPEQVTWHERARRAGVRVAVWRSAADAVKSVTDWRAADEYERAQGWR